MRQSDFIEALHNAGWEGVRDAQHDHIEILHAKLFPDVSALEDELETAIDRLTEMSLEIEGMLVGLHERGLIPDFITFADTGGERPHTYRHIDEVQRWLKSVTSILIIWKKQSLNLRLRERLLS